MTTVASAPNIVYEDTAFDVGPTTIDNTFIDLDADQIIRRDGDNYTAVSIKDKSGSEILEQAVVFLEDLLKDSNIHHDDDLALADIDFHLKKAMVQHVVGLVEDDVGKLYDSYDKSVERLAYILLPRLKLIGELQRYMAKAQRIKNDPDYNRCVFNMQNTLQFLIADVEPLLKQLTSAQGDCPGGVCAVAAGGGNKMDITEKLRRDYAGGGDEGYGRSIEVIEKLREEKKKEAEKRKKSGKKGGYKFNGW
jgi:hypothetical protein